MQTAQNVAGQLTAAIDDDDDDAFQSMFTFLVANLAVADAMATAADEPDQVARSMRLDSIDQFSTESWQRDVDDAVNDLLPGPGVVRGASVAGGPLDTALGTLTDQSGQQLVGIAKDAVLGAAIPNVGPALAQVLGGTIAKVFNEVQAGMHLGWAAIKRAASKVIEWVIDHITRLVPNGLRGVIEPAVDKVRASLTDDANHVISKAVGEVAGAVLGLEVTRTSWANATDATRAAALNRLPTATDGELSLISKVARVRGFFDRYGRWLDSLTKIPQVALALATLAVIAITLILSALWSGLRNVRMLVN
jgi:hypothetical protein